MLDDTVLLSSLLQKVLMLGKQAGSEKLRQWARQELNGYARLEDIPDYRLLRAPVYVRITNSYGHNGFTEHLSPSKLPKEIRDIADIEHMPLGTGVGELEGLVDKSTAEPVRLIPFWSDVMIDFLNKHGVDEVSRVQSLYWEVSGPPLNGILVRARAALTDLVSELASSLPEGRQTPTKTAADDAFNQAVSLVVTGERAVVQVITQYTGTGANVVNSSPDGAVVATGGGTAVGSQTASGQGATVLGSQTVSGTGNTVTGRDATPPATPSVPKEGFFKRWSKRGIAVGIATVVAAVVGVLQWLDWTPW